MLGSPKKIVLHSWSNFCVSESSNNIPSLRTFNILFRLLRDFQAQIRFSRNLLGIRPAIMAFLSFASLFYQLKVLILVFQSLHNKFLRISKEKTFRNSQRLPHFHRNMFLHLQCKFRIFELTTNMQSLRKFDWDNNWQTSQLHEKCENTEEILDTPYLDTFHAVQNNLFQYNYKPFVKFQGFLRLKMVFNISDFSALYQYSITQKFWFRNFWDSKTYL